MTISNLIKYLFSISRLKKKIIVFFIDIFLCTISMYMSAVILKKTFLVPINYDFLFLLITSFTFLPFFILFDFYNIIFRFINIKNLFNIFYAILLYSFLNLLLFYLSSIDQFSVNIIFIHSLIFTTLLLYFRLFIIFSKNNLSNPNNRKAVIVYGAGEVGSFVYNNFSELNVKAFIDDDINKQNIVMNNIKVHSFNNLESLILKYQIKFFIVAIKSLDIKKRKKILTILNKNKIIVKFLPDFININKSSFTFSNFRNINPEDLIERSVDWNKDKIKSIYFNKTVCVTGAGGSIGSEISKQILETNVKKLILVDHSELNLYKIDKYLNKLKKDLNFDTIKIVKILGSILEENILNEIFAHKLDCVFHAAAYKHVDMIEKNPISGIKNNIIGTIKLVDSVIENRIPNLIFISSDKAVSPSNLMGSTKRIGEKYIESLHGKSSTKFTIVRFGNVIGSSGSVFHLFKSQINSLSPITITHKDVTRYFMSIEEAVGLVMESSLMKSSNVIFVLNMGEPIKIIDLAKKMINLSGLTLKNETNNKGDIDIQYIGLGEGEKLHEDLIINSTFEKTSHKDILSINKIQYDKDYDIFIKKNVYQLLENKNVNQIRIILNNLVEGENLIN
jgi:FlaA1/EpsC-like NDP-sugar epimerase